MTCEFLALTPGRQDVGPNDKGAAHCAFSFTYIASSFPFCVLVTFVHQLDVCFYTTLVLDAF